jgi:hypothetical protein
MRYTIEINDTFVRTSHYEVEAPDGLDEDEVKNIVLDFDCTGADTPETVTEPEDDGASMEIYESDEEPEYQILDGKMEKIRKPVNDMQT